MSTLTSSERSRLEKAVLAARAVAEMGVGKRFANLDLAAAKAPDGLSAADLALRNGLRQRARDLGRGRVDPYLGNIAAIEAGVPFLIEELAYDTWHRMLFARFLAENHLLVHPEYGVSLSVGDVADLAAENGSDPWELAALFAADRLPGLFHLAHPLRLAAEDRQDLTTILAGLDASLFTAADALGWVYQFWQAKRKDEVNAAGEKISGNNLPAVTQLFTEDYIVDFLLQNSLGAWYVSRHADTRLKDDWPYLRYRDDGTPAAGTFETWPATVDKITVMDPCCGSGHFLVAAFHMLVAMRQEVEGLSPAEAADAVLRDNLFGLELDARCTQIATFAVALEAWKLGGHPETHLPRIACSGIPVSGQKEQWVKLAGNDANLEIALAQLYDLFSQASELGSLIDPRRAAMMPGTTRRGQHGFALTHEWERVERALHRALDREATLDPAAQIFATTDNDLVGTMRAARLLSRTYTLVATNVPFLGNADFDEALLRHARSDYFDSMRNLATMFLERCLALVQPGEDTEGNWRGAGSIATVTPQSWTFQKSYKRLRSKLLKHSQIELLARLGTGAFRSISGEVVNVSLEVITNTDPEPEHRYVGLDVSQLAGPDEKGAALRMERLSSIAQLDQLQNPDSQIRITVQDRGSLLEAYASSVQGLATSDIASFVRSFWELNNNDGGWEYVHTPSDVTKDYGGRSHILHWEKGNGRYYRHAMKLKLVGRLGGWKSGAEAWRKKGVCVSNMGNLAKTLYTGEKYLHSVNVIVPNLPDYLPAIWTFANSPEFNSLVREVDHNVAVATTSIVKVPFDFAHWQLVANERYPDGLPEPYSADPTQWLFDGAIPGSDHPLQVAVARLLGYRWPEQTHDGLDPLADPDGIVCLPSVYQEPPAHLRLRDLLMAAYGDAWSAETLAALSRQADATSLESWLREKRGFFAQHVKLFHHRPFLWQITDSRRDGFSAIVNYHRLTASALSKLIYTYLGDWISRQERAAEAGEAGVPAKLEAATALKAKLIAILEGEPPYDIYVRWKSLAEQPVGWHPDLNDGVRLNIRPFVAAGVLAGKVNVKWGKDRGKDPEVRHEPLLTEASSELKKRLELHASTDRHNDLHFTRAEKERARTLATSINRVTQST